MIHNKLWQSGRDHPKWWLIARSIQKLGYFFWYLMYDATLLLPLILIEFRTLWNSKMTTEHHFYWVCLKQRVFQCYVWFPMANVLSLLAICNWQMGTDKEERAFVPFQTACSKGQVASLHRTKTLRIADESRLTQAWLAGSIAGWWFGTSLLFFHVFGMSSSQLTNSIIFQRGRYTTNQIW